MRSVHRERAVLRALPVIGAAGAVRVVPDVADAVQEGGGIVIAVDQVAAIIISTDRARGLAAEEVGAGIKFGLVASRDRKSGVEGKSVSVRVDLGGWRIIKKKNNMM